MNKTIKIIIILLLTLFMSLLTGCGTKNITQAAADGDIDTVAAMLEKQPELLNGKNKTGNALIRVAAANGQIEMMEFLLGKGADLERHAYNSRSGYTGVTAFLMAVRFGTLETMEWLIKKGADIHARTGKPRSFSNAVNMAVSAGSIEKTRRLIQLGVEIGSSEKGFYNPLIYSVFGHNPELTRLLLENGASLTTGGKRKNTLLHWAVREGDKETARLLIEYGADVNARNNNERIPLHNILYWRGDLPELTALLLEKGSLPDARDKEGNTPLHHAAHNRCTGSARLMLAKGAGAGIEGYMKRTPLQVALMRGAKGVKELLTSLHTAASKGKLEKVKELYARYPQLLNSRDEDGRTPLHLAAFHNRRGIAAFLIGKGAGIHALSRYRRVNLIHGVIARLLVPKNGRIKRFVHAKTPLGIALERNHNEMAQLLKAKGAAKTFKIRR